ncbi:MAG TPA: Nif3-like dinuclear metal center hexameric protein [Bacteroidia bacterium]|nr:Nif3-like dinuclear metal center hexameric protein [Bacteroidia bacterium]
MKIAELIDCLEKAAPPHFQENYDNSRLITGNRAQDVDSALLCLDCTEEVIEEAMAHKCRLVIAHHPVLFSGLKKLTGETFVERTLIKAIQNDIAIYACHTNMDNVMHGVNHKIASRLGLQKLRVLDPKPGLLRKLVTFVPFSHLEQIRQALFEAGAGHIGNYDSCSFNSAGTGTFRGNEQSRPFIGKAGILSQEEEIRLEVICDNGNEGRVVKALRSAHPYEEPAFDLYPLGNVHPRVGSGLIGEFENPKPEAEFLAFIKKTFNTTAFRHTRLLSKPIKTLALCGGSGRFLLEKAIASGADAFLTSDFKYHDYFEVDGKLLLADVGHFETEQFTPEIFSELIREKFPKFAIRLSEIRNNPVHYYI